MGRDQKWETEEAIGAGRADAVLGFEDGGRDYKPRHASGLWRLKKARMWI